MLIMKKLHWSIWYRKTSRKKTGPWRFFFCTDRIDVTEAAKLVSDFSLERSFEHLAIPADEYPDEATAKRAAMFGNESL